MLEQGECACVFACLENDVPLCSQATTGQQRASSRQKKGPGDNVAIQRYKAARKQQRKVWRVLVGRCNEWGC